MQIDPLEQTYVDTRPPLGAIPWNKVSLTDDGRQAVSQALSAGYPRHQIAKALGTSVKTLKRLIDDDPTLGDAIDARKDAEEAELREILMGMARSGDTVAAIFLGKSQFGWRDRDEASSKSKPVSAGGVLLLPADLPLHEWEAAAAAQQAQYREQPVTAPAPGNYRTRSLGIEGLTLERA